MFNHILLSEYCNFLFKPDGTVWNYDNMVLKQFPLPEPVTPGAAGHPYGYAIGKSGALYMLWGDSVKWQKIDDDVEHVAAYWDWVVIAYSTGAIVIFQHGKYYADFSNEPIDVVQIAAAHDVVIRCKDGSVWEYQWSKTAWKSGTQWQHSAADMRALKPIKKIDKGATDITTARTQHSTAIVDGKPFSWWRSLGARYINKSTDTIANPTPRDMTTAWGLTEKITQVRSSDNTTHVITVSGKALGKGNNALGEVGNGQKHPTVLATGKWDMGLTLWVDQMVEVGRPGEFYVDLFKGTSYGHRESIITDKLLIRFCGRNKYGLLNNGIYPEQPSDPAKLFEGMWSVATFRRAIFPERLTLKTADEGWAMTKAGTYPPKEPRVLVRTVTTQYFDDGTFEESEVKAI